MESKSEHTASREPVASCTVSHGYKDYEYSIREENGKVLLCAYHEGHYRSRQKVNINNIVIGTEDMDELSNLCNKYLTDADLKGNDDSNNSGVTSKVEIVWESGKRFQATIAAWEINKNKAELVFMAHVLSFFDGLCKRLDECYYKASARPFADGNVIAFRYSEGRGGRRPESYEMRDDLGDFLFDADVYTDALDANNKANSDEMVQLRDEIVFRDDMDKFNLLCKELKLHEQQFRAASADKVYIEPCWKEKSGVFDTERYKVIGDTDESGVAPSFTAVWDNGVSFTMDALSDCMAGSLREFFRSLVTCIQSKPEEKVPDGKIVSVRFSGVEISRFEREGGGVPKERKEKRTGYCFHLWEENGEFNFEGSCLFRNFRSIKHLYREFKIEKTSATQEDMESLRKICGKNSFSEKWHSYPKKKIENKKFALERQGDMERERLEVIWENGVRLDMRLFDKEYTAHRELKSYFIELAERLDRTLPAEGKVVAFQLEGEYKASDDGEPVFIGDMRLSTAQDTPKKVPKSRRNADYLLRYEYHMREVDGEVLFSAYESDNPNTSSWFERKEKPTCSIENTHLETLRALCESHAFAEEIQSYQAKRWQDYVLNDYWQDITDCRPNCNHDFFEIVWENGARCEGTKLPKKFRNFFTETVNSIPSWRNTLSGGWTCSCGYIGNAGRFCKECGARAPN